jgi:hypothetical protein
MGMKAFLSFLVAFIVLSVAVLGADKKSNANKKPKFSPGDKVEVEWNGKKVQAEFVEYFATGWITVKFKENGLVMNPTVPPEKVHPIAKKEAGGDKANGSKMRTWTDKTGKFKTKAKFVELKDGEVTLETDAGKTVKMPIEKLSKADQEVAQQAAKEADENPFKTDDDGDNPFAGGDDESTDTADAAGTPKEGDWTSCETINVQSPGAWSLKPDVAPTADKLITKPIMMASTLKSKSGGELGFFEAVDGLLLSRGAPRAFAVIRDGSPGKPLDVKIQMIDLAQGKAQEPIKYTSSMKPVDTDPAGEQILSRSDHMFSPGDKQHGLSVWKMKDKGLQLVKSWSPQEPGNVHKVAPSYAQFIDADHVVSISFPHKLSMWQVSTAKALYRLELGTGGVVGLSGNRKYLAAPVNNGLYVLDALTGDTLAQLPGDPGVLSAVSFRPDGTQLAAVSPQRIMVWNLNSGELYRDIYFSKAINASTIDWLDSGYILVGGESLVDLERRIVLWKYMHQAGTGFSRGYGELGGQFWYALTSQDRKERALFNSKLPHDDAKKKASTLNAESLLAIQPGSQISLSFNLQGAPEEQQKAVQALTAQLAANGMKVNNGGALVLQASTETGKSQEISYRSFGRGGRNSETAKVTEQISRVRLIENGKVLWEAVSVSGAPHFLQMKEGETLDQALAKYQQPNLQFFSTVKVPQYVARPSEAGAYGASNLTPQGIQPAQLIVQQGGVTGN